MTRVVVVGGLGYLISKRAIWNFSESKAEIKTSKGSERGIRNRLNVVLSCNA